MKFLFEFNEFNISDKESDLYEFTYQEIEEIKEISSDFLQAGVEGEMPIIVTGELDLILGYESKIKFSKDETEYQALAIIPKEDVRINRYMLNDFNNLDSKQLETMLSNSINDIIVISSNMQILITKKSYYNYLKKILSIENMMDNVTEEIEFERIIWDDTLNIESYGGARGMLIFLIVKKDMTDVPLEISFKPTDPLISESVSEIEFKIYAGIQARYTVSDKHQEYMDKIVETINKKDLSITIGLEDSDDNIVQQFTDMIEENIFTLLEDDNVRNYKSLISTFDEIKEKYDIDVEYDDKFIPKEINNVYFKYKGKQVEIGIKYNTHNQRKSQIEIYSNRTLLDEMSIPDLPEYIFLMMMDKLEENISFKDEDIKRPIHHRKPPGIL